MKINGSMASLCRRSGRLLAMKKPFAAANILNLLLVFVPVAGVLEFAHASPLAIFGAACLAIIPLAGLMGKATEHLAEKMGEGVGGLLNATFGNAAELTIALMAIRLSEYEVVKASITGSIIGNVLLVFGLSVLIGGLTTEAQRFNRTAASLGTTLLVLSAIGLIVPATFHFLVQGKLGDQAVVQNEHELSFEIAVVLMITYALSLVFSLKTHKHLYGGGTSLHRDEAIGLQAWSTARSVAVLIVATGLVGVMSELLVGAVDKAAAQVGMTKVFVGVILVAIIGNAAEHSTAVLMAMKNKMDLALNIAVGSSIQIALFVAPMLVFASYVIGPEPMDLLFTDLEVIAIVLSVGIMALVAQDGESNWMEGVQLLAVYIILGIAFFYLPV
jgi:Ca2+:H+ antiporter